MGTHQKVLDQPVESMKLLSTILFVEAASAASVNCMQSDAPDSIILMTATVNNADFDYDLTKDPEWNCVDVEENNTVCKRQWTAEMFTAEGEKTFSDTHLILKKQVAQKMRKCRSRRSHNLHFKRTQHGVYVQIPT